MSPGDNPRLRDLEEEEKSIKDTQKEHYRGRKETNLMKTCIFLATFYHLLFREKESQEGSEREMRSINS